jgi:hypothetical protein
MHMIKAKSATIRYIQQRIYRSSAGRQLFSVHISILLACCSKLAKNGSVRRFSRISVKIYEFLHFRFTLFYCQVFVVCRVFLSVVVVYC